MRGVGGTIAVWAVFFLTATLAPASPADDRATARGYCDQAEPLIRAGSYAQAARLLEAGLEFDPGYSDAWYLLSRALRPDASLYARGLAALERAVKEDSWERVSPQAARVELAGELLRTGRAAEAARELSRLEPALSPDPQASILLGRALLEQSAWREADAALEEALRRFPREPRLYRLRARSLAALDRGAEARRLLDGALRAFPAQTELLLERARLEPSSAKRLGFIRRYGELGGADPAAALLALRSSPPEPKEYLQLFLRQGGDRRLDELIEAGRLTAGRPALRRVLEEAARGYEGERGIDRNGDGLREETYLYRGGALQGWALDADQDGRPEARAMFAEGGVPTELTLGEEPRGAVRLRYEPYPYLQSVELGGASSGAEDGAWTMRTAHSGQASGGASSGAEDDGQEGPSVAEARDGGRRPASGGRCVYHLPLARLTADLIQRLPSPGALPVRLRLTLSDYRPDTLELKKAAWRLDETDGAGLTRRSATLLAGRPVEIQEDLDGDGRFDRLIRHRDGAPVEGALDLDGNGRFEVREEYLRGVLVRLLWDEDGDGKPEYAETPGTNGTRSWDYDGDGVFDRHEIIQPDGSRLEKIYRPPGLSQPAAPGADRPASPTDRK